MSFPWNLLDELQRHRTVCLLQSKRVSIALLVDIFVVVSSICGRWSVPLRPRLPEGGGRDLIGDLSFPGSVPQPSVRPLEFLKVFPPSPKNVIIFGKKVSRSVLQDSETALLFTAVPADGLPEYFVCRVEIRLLHFTELLPGISFGLFHCLAAALRACTYRKRLEISLFPSRFFNAAFLSLTVSCTSRVYQAAGRPVQIRSILWQPMPLLNSCHSVSTSVDITGICSNSRAMLSANFVLVSIEDNVSYFILWLLLKTDLRMVLHFLQYSITSNKAVIR
ncbi:unnamed protein product [Soboliphyme baturini]|uniref:UDENN domain-containing protein n=1 Tax=Soboliphyme baturini TaxID=241478 RepID=A0A183IDV3_9BILA|nr:unnamed protein product [Soboliphyme baturini]